MTSVTHSFISAKSDGGDATLVRPSDWNAEHVVEGDIPHGHIGCRLGNSAVENHSGSYAAFAFPTEVRDSDGFHSTSSNTSRITIPAGLGGPYRFVTAVTGPTNGHISIKKNGVSYLAFQNLASSEAALTVDDDAVPGDYYEVFANNNGNAMVYFFTAEKLDAGHVGSGVGASASASGTQSISHATDTALALNAADTFDTDGFHDPASNNTRVTIPAGLGGKYLVIGGTGYPANGTGVRVLFFKKNGTTVGHVRIFVATAAAFHSPQLSEILDLAAGDYIELWTSQDSGGSLNAGSGTATTLQIMRLDSQPASYADPLQYLLGADVTMTTAATWYTGPSGTPPAGTYDIYWAATILGNISNATSLYGRLVKGSTELDYREQLIGLNNARGSFGGFALGVVLDGSTIVKIEATANQNSASIQRNGGNGTNNTASKIELRRVK